MPCITSIFFFLNTKEKWTKNNNNAPCAVLQLFCIVMYCPIDYRILIYMLPARMLAVVIFKQHFAHSHVQLNVLSFVLCIFFTLLSVWSPSTSTESQCNVMVYVWMLLWFEFVSCVKHILRVELACCHACTQKSLITRHRTAHTDFEFRIYVFIYNIYIYFCSFYIFSRIFFSCYICSHASKNQFFCFIVRGFAIPMYVQCSIKYFLCGCWWW